MPAVCFFPHLYKPHSSKVLNLLDLYRQISQKSEILQFQDKCFQTNLRWIFKASLSCFGNKYEKNLHLIEISILVTDPITEHLYKLEPVSVLLVSSVLHSLQHYIQIVSQFLIYRPNLETHKHIVFDHIFEYFYCYIESKTFLQSWDQAAWPDHITVTKHMPSVPPWPHDNYFSMHAFFPQFRKIWGLYYSYQNQSFTFLIGVEVWNEVIQQADF